MRPDIPRWITKVSPLSSSARIYLARRVSFRTMRPVSRSRETGRKGTPQIFAPNQGLRDDAAFQRGHKPQAHGLDFG